MKYLTMTLAGLFVLGGGLATDAWAQKGMGQTEGLARQGVQPELVTFSGVVAEIKQGTCEATTGKSVVGTHVLLKTEEGAVREVHLGPKADVDPLIAKIAVGDPLTVTGFRTELLPENAWVAQTLTVTEQVIRMRNDDLRPVWAVGPGQGQGFAAGPGKGRGQGRGNGRGQGLGRNAGPGQGPALSPGQGQGRGMGAGRGAGRGQGMGNGGMQLGQGQGRGQGFGRNGGPGQGPAFSPGQGQGRGMGAGRGAGRGRGMGNGGVQSGQGLGQGQGQGRGFCGGRGYLAGGQPCKLAQGAACETQMKGLLDATPQGQLTEEQQQGLLLMREEEKLAHDVYVTLHQKWSLQPFANIPQAEARHQQFVKMLLERYGLEDPVDEMGIGRFAAAPMQDLYDKLVARGKQSVEEAIRVGALIEDLDIYDLQRLMGQTDNPDLLLVYENLLRGSRNHLRAFSRQLSRYGVSYEAQHLSQAEFDQIAAGPHEPGGPGRNAN